MSEAKSEQGSMNEMKEIVIKSMPTCNNMQFNLEDFIEVFNAVNNEELTHNNFRPSKIKRWYATKACKFFFNILC